MSSWSKDPSSKVAAIIVDNKFRLVSAGYNGLPQKVEDSEKRLNNRELKYKIVIHAETNALLFARQSVEGGTIYTWPFQPCSNCASNIIQAGISRVVAPYSDNPRWKDGFKLSEELFKEAGVDLILFNDLEVT